MSTFNFILVCPKSWCQAQDGGHLLHVLQLDNPDIVIKHGGTDKRLTDEERRLLKRRQAIEPIIGHDKVDHRMGRCHLKGSAGDALRAVLCAAGYNIRRLMRMIVKKDLSLLLCLLQVRVCGLSG